MSTSPNTQAILLLAAHFSRPKKTDPRPLTPTEWGRFANWLNENSLSPENLMTGNLANELRGWSDKSVTLERIEALMERGSALALAVEKWYRAKLWVLTRSDEQYPNRLKTKLGLQSPPVLFGAGNVKLLNGGGLGVVGSRNTSDNDLKFSKCLGEKVAIAGHAVISGGAKGVDESAMMGALDSDGQVVGVLADSLLRNSTSRKYREHLENHNLALVSPFFPEVGFSVGNAMARNKYIYCLADAALVVHSGTKGGTWTGAHENLKKNWVPLYVKRTDDVSAGNADIVKAGGNWVPADIDDVKVSGLLDGSIKNLENNGSNPVDDESPIEKFDGSPAGIAAQPESSTYPAENSSLDLMEPAAELSVFRGQESNQDFYDLFLVKLEHACASSEKTPDQLVDELKLTKSQLNIWLKQALAENKIQKLNKPVRYTLGSPNRKFDF